MSAIRHAMQAVEAGESTHPISAPAGSDSSAGLSRSRILLSTGWLLAGLILLAAVVRIYWGLQPRVVWGDEPFYLWLGETMLKGGGYWIFPPQAGIPGISGAHFSPLFPILAGLIGRLVGDLAAGSVVVYVLCGALLVLPIYGLARRVNGPDAALGAALMTALNPVLVAAVPLWGTMTEPLYLLCLATAWWGLLVALQEGSMGGYALAGASLGLAYLTRTETLVYLVVGLIVVILLRLTMGSTARIKRTLLGTGLALGVFAILVSPYLIVEHAQTGRWQLTEEAGFAYTSMQGLVEKDTAAFDKATWGLDKASGEVSIFAPASESQGLVDAVKADPEGFIRLVRTNVRKLLAVAVSAGVLPWPLAGLALLGLFGRPWGARRLRGELLLIASLAGPLSFILFAIQPRYLVGALMPALVWTGSGIALLGDWLVGTWEQISVRKSPPSFLRVLPALLVALTLVWQMPRLWDALHQTHSFQNGHLAAAAALRAYVTAGAEQDGVVMSRYPAIAFHAGMRWAPTPSASWSEVVRYARQRNTHYLVFDAWEASLRPELSFLLNPNAAPADLRHLATVDAGAGPVVVYEFR